MMMMMMMMMMIMMMMMMMMMIMMMMMMLMMRVIGCPNELLSSCLELQLSSEKLLAPLRLWSVEKKRKGLGDSAYLAANGRERSPIPPYFWKISYKYHWKNSRTFMFPMESFL